MICNFVPHKYFWQNIQVIYLSVSYLFPHLLYIVDLVSLRVLLTCPMNEYYFLCHQWATRSVDLFLRFSFIISMAYWFRQDQTTQERVLVSDEFYGILSNLRAKMTIFAKSFNLLNYSYNIRGRTSILTWNVHLGKGLLTKWLIWG